MMKRNAVLLIVMSLLISSCITNVKKNDKISSKRVPDKIINNKVVEKLKSNPNDLNTILETYNYLEMNYLFSEQWLTSWRYLILEENKANAYKVLDVFAYRLFTTIEGNQMYVSTEALSKSGMSLVLEMTFGISKAAIFKREKIDRTYIKKTIEFFNSFLKVLKGSYAEALKKENEHDVLLKYLAPYFIELYEKNYTETFVYRIFSSYNDNDVDLWLNKNSIKVQEFLKWSSNYIWQK